MHSNAFVARALCFKPWWKLSDPKAPCNVEDVPFAKRTTVRKISEGKKDPMQLLPKSPIPKSCRNTYHMSDEEHNYHLPQSEALAYGVNFTTY